jgi:hypothetical protein
MDSTGVLGDEDEDLIIRRTHPARRTTWYHVTARE